MYVYSRLEINPFINLSPLVSDNPKSKWLQTDFIDRTLRLQSVRDILKGHTYRPVGRAGI